MGRGWFIELAFDEVRVAIALGEIDRVCRAVEISRVSGAPGCLLGVIDVRGAAVPVYDTRRLLGLPPRGLRLSDRLLLTRGTPQRAFLADRVLGTCEADVHEPPQSFAAQASGVRGVTRGADGLLTIRSLRQFMAFERVIPLRQADSA